MNLPIKILILVVLASCTPKEDKETSDSESRVLGLEDSGILSADTSNYSYPVQIGNEKGLIKISGIRIFKDQKLFTSGFSIILEGFENDSISKHIDKSVLVDAYNSEHLNDTADSDFLNSAILKSVKFEFVRSNTLYFKATLENPETGIEILGRFNLFYRTNRRGVVYGWITDEIRDLKH